MSWCDKLASRPTVGFTFNKHFRPSSDLLSAVIPVLDKLAGPIADKFSLAKQDSFGIEFITENGFKYAMDPSKVAVEFQHRLKVKNTSGGMPVAELISKQEPYTVLLQDVGNRAVEAAELLIGSQRILERIGVVSATIVDESDAPPGILRCIDYLTGPWKAGVSHYGFQIVSVVSVTDEWEDKCIHSITKAESDEGLLSLSFDYHRIYKTHKDKNSIRSALAGVQEGALTYFEDLAQGDMFDANDDASN